MPLQQGSSGLMDNRVVEAFCVKRLIAANQERMLPVRQSQFKKNFKKLRSSNRDVSVLNKPFRR
jgi:hypothetical protein